MKNKNNNMSATTDIPDITNYNLDKEKSEENKKKYAELFKQQANDEPRFLKLVQENPYLIKEREDAKGLIEVEFKKPMRRQEDAGLRFNEGKLRYDLLEPFALEQLVRVFTKGAEKYADNNWLKGMKWNKMLASAQRHQAAFLRGEDYDFYPDTCEACKKGNCTNHTGELHAAQAAWNWMALTSFYKHFPEGDDRLHNALPKKKIGLDIDEVLADWVGHWTKKHGQEVPETWNFDRNIKEKFDLLKDDKEFWLSIPVKTPASDISFEPHCYITSRSIPIEWTKEWLDKNGFPTMPVYCVPFGVSKIDVAREAGIDWFIDDRYENYEELNRAGICTFLFDAPHNRRYDVGYKRIKDFKDLKTRFL